MKTIRTKWTGIRPLIMHNGLMVDPTNELVIEIKGITSKGSKKMTEADHEQRNNLEWEAGLYWDEKEGPVIPSANIERCIQLGAQKSRLGKDVKAVVFCTEPNIKLEYDGPRAKNKMYKDSRFSIRCPVTIQKSRIIRVRPMIPTNWSLDFELEFDETILNPKDLHKAMVDAGALIGLGDWRPKFGRFLVETE